MAMEKEKRRALTFGKSQHVVFVFRFFAVQEALEKRMKSGLHAKSEQRRMSRQPRLGPKTLRYTEHPSESQSRRSSSPADRTTAGKQTAKLLTAKLHINLENIFDRPTLTRCWVFGPHLPGK